MPEELQTQPEAPRKRSRAALRTGLAGGAVVLLLLVLGVGWARASAKRYGCRNQLRCLAIAMHLYADENDNDFPASLDLLYPQYTDNLRIFVCPSNLRWPDGLRPESLEQEASYCYLPGRTSCFPASFYLMCDKPGNHGGSGINAVRVDSSVEWWPASRAAELQRRVELQNEAVAKWRAAGKSIGALDDFIGPELRELMKKSVINLGHNKI